MESKLFENILKEATYNWNIDFIDRSWFLYPNNDIKSDMSHRIILKQTYKDEWFRLKQIGENDSDIESVFENRLIKSGVIKIGELDNFYIVVQKLNSREKDMIQGFSLLTI